MSLPLVQNVANDKIGRRQWRGQAQADEGGAGSLARKIAPFVVFAVIALIPPPAGLDRNQWTYFALFAGAIAGLVFESAAPGAVGFVAMTTAAVLGLVEKGPGQVSAMGAAWFRR